MSLKIKRIIIDTKLWISFLITNDFKKLDQFLDPDKYQIVFSEELFNEFPELIFFSEGFQWSLIIRITGIESNP